MEQRILGKTGRNVSIVGLGTWQLGADWGNVDPAQAQAILDASAEAGVTFFDTADVYGDGRSEQAIGAFLAANPDLDITVATKMGRRVEQRAGELHARRTSANGPTGPGATSASSSSTWSSCTARPPPSTATTRCTTRWTRWSPRAPSRNYGVSVETDATRRSRRSPDRHAPPCRSSSTPSGSSRWTRCCPRPAAAGVGIIARVPLASGLLSGKYTADTSFAADDHRNYNRDGAAFDVGETFSGVDFGEGLKAVAEFQELVPDGVSTAQAALAWIAAQEGVSTVIPGARNVEQARANAEAASVSGIDATFDVGVHEIYDRYFREAIHPRW